MTKFISDSDYWLTRFVILRLLGFVYLFAFLGLAFQIVPLVGEDGLYPADNYLNNVGANFESKWDAFVNVPSIFWLGVSDTWLLVLSWFGVMLSLILLWGFANSIMLFVLWFLYMSFIHIGQVFYGYGWEIQLLETTFLTMFLVPLIDWRPFPKTPPPMPIIWLFRWMAFRIYLGAGLIKIRGGECWRKFTCLYYHYESQPIPNPVSPWIHFMPQWFHKLGVLWNHFVELVVPWFVFWPRVLRLSAGVLMLTFQFMLIISGNLSFLNWVTIIPVIACFDDKFLRRILPKRLVDKAEYAKKRSRTFKCQTIAAWMLVIIVVFLSFSVVKNLLSPGQHMNTSFDRLHLVNTYGAFGSVGEVRNELVVQGSYDGVEWIDYEFKAKPTNVDRRLAIVAPYQPRVDWQIWFAAMQTPNRNPWLIHLLWKFLHNDEGALSLISDNPFPDMPPKFVRIEFFRYQFVEPGYDKPTWNRTHLGTWLPPVTVNNEELRKFISSNGWEMFE